MAIVKIIGVHKSTISARYGLHRGLAGNVLNRLSVLL